MKSHKSEDEIVETFKNVDCTLLDAAGKLYVQLRHTLDGIIEHLAVRLTFGEKPNRCVLQWIESTLVEGESNPAIERDLSDVVGQSCRTACEHVRLALDALVNDVATLLQIPKSHAWSTLDLYSKDTDEKEPPEDGFTAWAETHLYLEATYPDDDEEEEEEEKEAAAAE